MWVKIKSFIKDTRLIAPLEIIKWVSIDVIRRFKNKEDRIKNFVKYSGIHIVTGRTGGGKTTVALALLDDYIKRFGRENIYIASNTWFEDLDFEVFHWGDLTLYYNKPLVFIYDEANTDFPQNAYKNIDKRLRTALAQNRKGKGKAIFAISQDYNMLLNEFRRLSKNVYWAKTLWGRYTRARRYDTMEWEQMISNTDIDKKMKSRPNGRVSVIQTDRFRERYSSFALVRSIKEPWEEYVIRKELLDKIDTEMTDLSQYKVEE